MLDTAEAPATHQGTMTTGKRAKLPPSALLAAAGGILLAPSVCIWVFRSEILYRSADLASSSLPVAAVVVLLGLLLVRRLFPVLGRREVLWMYAVVTATVGISTMGMVQFLVTTLAAPFWFANAGNRWEEFWAHIPAWVAPRSPEVVKGFFVGQSSLYLPQVWKAWLVPVLVWAGFIAVLLVAQFCLAAVFSLHWARRERLTFPMLQLPLVLTQERSARKPMLWAGIALGLRPATAVTLFAVFFLCMVSIGWLRAALGPIWNPGNDVAWWTRALMRSPMPVSEGVGLAYLRWFSFGDFRAHALPTYSEMLVLADASRIPRKPFLVSLGIASLLSIFASLWIALDVYYRHGASSAITDQWRTYQGRLAFDILRSQLNGLAPQPDTAQLLAAGWGAVFVLLLQAARHQFLWFPLHPGGFVMAQSGALEWMWVPIVIAGVLKAGVLRAGGLRLYEKAAPLFIGLIVGDYAVCGVLAFASWFFHIPLYKPFPV